MSEIKLTVCVNNTPTTKRTKIIKIINITVTNAVAKTLGNEKLCIVIKATLNIIPVKMIATVFIPEIKVLLPVDKTYDSGVDKTLLIINGNVLYAVTRKTSLSFPIPPNKMHTAQFASVQSNTSPTVCASCINELYVEELKVVYLKSLSVTFDTPVTKNNTVNTQANKREPCFLYLISAKLWNG